MADAISEILSSIQSKIKRLKQRNDRLEEENAVLRETVFKHLGTIGELKQALETKETSKVISEISQNEKVDAKKVRSMIDQYIKLIDNSIATLKQKD
jgi:predicted nuclease with TOPRIM domain